MNILVVGGGGREHALVWRLRQSPLIEEIYCAPGNAGIAQDARCVPIGVMDINGLLSFAQEQKVDLTVFGPEAPLVAGAVDRFREAGLLACGPTKSAANAEGSKAWFKCLLQKYDIPTAPFKIFRDPIAAFAYIKDRGPKNTVTKASGLAAGKGVFLPDNLNDAETALAKLMVKGSPGEWVVIEDRIYGHEISMTAITDGVIQRVLPFARDHKRIWDGDKGPNTGGMGAYTLSLPQSDKEDLCHILRLVLSAIESELGEPYTGFIYLGFMMTKDGPMVLECNCRLGDPEAQVILPSIGGDFAELCMAAATQKLMLVRAPQQIQQALSIVAAAQEYPESSWRDDVITGLDEARETGALIFHAGTIRQGDGPFTTGKAGRVLACTGVAETSVGAGDIATAAIEKIHFDGMQRRRDIGASMADFV